MIARFGMMSHDTMVMTAVGMGHNKFLGYLSLIEAVSNILLSLYLVKIWGVIGVALGTVIPVSITRAFIVPVYCCKLVNIKLKEYFIKVLLPTLTYFFPLIVVTYEMTKLIPPSSYFRLFLNVTISFSVLCALLYIYIEPEFKLLIENKIRRKFLRSKLI